MKTAIADYILCLSTPTNYANDRPLLEKYLAHAAVLLAMVEKGDSLDKIKQKILDHDRLLSQTWLEGPEYKKIYQAFEQVKSMAGI
jgi:hypothetical protein